MLMSDLVDQRLDTQNVADALPLVTRRGRDLPDGVHEMHAGHPFVDCELGFAAEVVEVFDEAAQDEAGAVVGFWADGFDYVGGEVWIETGFAGRGLVGGVLGGGLRWWLGWCLVLVGHCDGCLYV